MNVILDWSVVVLPTILAVVAMWFDPPRKMSASGWRIIIVIFAVCIGGLTYWQQRRQRGESGQQAVLAEQRAEGRQEATQQKLTEAIQQQKKLNDQNNDLKTKLQSLIDAQPADLQKRIRAIPKNYVRNLDEDLIVKATASTDPH